MTKNDDKDTDKESYIRKLRKWHDFDKLIFRRDKDTDKEEKLPRRKRDDDNG